MRRDTADAPKRAALPYRATDRGQHPLPRATDATNPLAAP